MTSFLTIPRELRDKIITIVLNTPRLAPKYDSAIHPRSDGRDSTPWQIDQNVIHESLTNRVEMIPLLLANRQLYHETLDAIERLPNKHSYLADILFVGEKQMWSTWLLVPELSPRIDKVHVSIRLGPPGECHALRRPAFRCGDGGPPMIYWYFYELLQKLLAFRPANQSIEHVGVKLLELDVVTPPASSLSSTHRSDPISQRMSTPERRTREICGLINSGIGYLLAMREIRVSKCTILYRGIGKIRAMRDGVIFKEWDIGALLESADLDECFKSVAQYEEWIAETRLARLQRGLPIVKPDE